jgi:hypothetical protein
MVKTENISLGGQEFTVKTKRIYQKDLTSDCWLVQVWGLDYCSGYGNPADACEYLGKKDCGGQNIRKMMLAGKYPRDGLPDVSSGRKR